MRWRAIGSLRSLSHLKGHFGIRSFLASDLLFQFCERRARRTNKFFLLRLEKNRLPPGNSPPPAHAQSAGWPFGPGALSGISISAILYAPSIGRARLCLQKSATSPSPAKTGLACTRCRKNQATRPSLRSSFPLPSRGALNAAQRVVVLPAVHIVYQHPIHQTHNVLVIALLQSFGHGHVSLVQRDGNVIGAVRVQPWRRAVHANLNIGLVDDLDIDLELLSVFGGGVRHRE